MKIFGTQLWFLNLHHGNTQLTIISRFTSIIFIIFAIRRSITSWINARLNLWWELVVCYFALSFIPVIGFNYLFTVFSMIIFSFDMVYIVFWLFKLAILRLHMAPTINLHGLHGSPLAPHIAGFEAFLNFQIFGVFLIELRQNYQLEKDNHASNQSTKPQTPTTSPANCFKLTKNLYTWMTAPKTTRPTRTNPNLTENTTSRWLAALRPKLVRRRMILRTYRRLWGRIV